MVGKKQKTKRQGKISAADGMGWLFSRWDGLDSGLALGLGLGLGTGNGRTRGCQGRKVHWGRGDRFLWVFVGVEVTQFAVWEI